MPRHINPFVSPSTFSSFTIEPLSRSHDDGPMRSTAESCPSAECHELKAPSLESIYHNAGSKTAISGVQFFPLRSDGFLSPSLSLSLS